MPVLGFENGINFMKIDGTIVVYFIKKTKSLKELLLLPYEKNNLIYLFRTFNINHIGL
jgi:hypothetical protein